MCVVKGLLYNSLMVQTGAKKIEARAALPLWLRAVFFSVAYFLCALIGSQLSVPGSVQVSFWLPAGLFISVLLRNPTNDWPWLVLAVFPAGVAFEMLHDPAPDGRLIIIFYFANVVRSVTGAWLVRKFIAEKPTLTTLKEFFGVMVLAGIVSALLGGFIGSLSLRLLGLNEHFFLTWFRWWAGSAMAVLVFSPLLLTWSQPPPGQRIIPWPLAKEVEITLLFCGLSLSAWWFLVWGAGVNAPKVPLLIFALWAGLRFGACVAAMVVLWMALLMSFLTTHFLTGLSPTDIASGNYIVTLQVFMAVTALVGLVPPIILAERDRTLAQLRESEERYRNLTRASFEGIIISENGRVIDVNQQCLDQFGCAREEVVGRELLDFVAPGSRAAAAEAIRVRREKLIEYQLLRKDGTTFHAEVQSKVMQLGERFVGMMALRDITERKRAEDLSRSQKQVLEMITGGAPMPQTLDALLRAVEAQSPDLLASILLLDADGVHARHGAAPSLPTEYLKAIDGMAIGLSAGSCGTAMFRREPVSVTDIASDPLWVDYKSIALAHGLRACWSTPIFDAQKNILGSFAIYQRQPGLPTEWHRRLIETATQTAAVCIAKQRADESLKASEEALRASIEYTPNVAVQWYDLAGRVIFWNRASEKIYGWSAAEAQGKTLDQLIFSAEQTANFQHLLKLIIGNGEPIGPREFPFRRRDGSAGVTFSTIFRIPVHTGELRFVCMDVDITERKKAEAEREASVAREQKARIEYTLRLIASQEAERKRIAAELHDSLGQNLLLIKNLAAMTLREEKPVLALNHLASIDQLAAQCIAETRQISRDLHPPQLDHLGLKRALELMLETTAQASEIKFTWKFDDADKIFSAEAAMNFYRIVQESLNNILKHSRAKNARVEMERDLHEVQLLITDDGCGYATDDPDVLKRGMGLRNLTERARMLGGALQMDSAPGQGTRLTVTVPIHEVAE